MRVRVPVRDKLDPVWSDPVPVAANVGSDTVRLQDGSVRNARDVAPIPSLIPAKDSKSSISDSSTGQTTSLDSAGRAQQAEPLHDSPTKPSSSKAEGASSTTVKPSERTTGVARLALSSKAAALPAPQAVRRSERSTKGQTSRYKDFVKF